MKMKVSHQSHKTTEYVQNYERTGYNLFIFSFCFATMYVCLFVFFLFFLLLTVKGFFFCFL